MCFTALYISRFWLNLETDERTSNRKNILGSRRSGWKYQHSPFWSSGPHGTSLLPFLYSTRLCTSQICQHWDYRLLLISGWKWIHFCSKVNRWLHCTICFLQERAIQESIFPSQAASTGMFGLHCKTYRINSYPSCTIRTNSKVPNSRWQNFPLQNFKNVFVLASIILSILTCR